MSEENNSKIKSDPLVLLLIKDKELNFKLENYCKKNPNIDWFELMKKPSEAPQALHQ